MRPKKQEGGPAESDRLQRSSGRMAAESKPSSTKSVYHPSSARQLNSGSNEERHAGPGVSVEEAHPPDLKHARSTDKVHLKKKSNFFHTFDHHLNTIPAFARHSGSGSRQSRCCTCRSCGHSTVSVAACSACATHPAGLCLVVAARKGRTRDGFRRRWTGWMSKIRF